MADIFAKKKRAKFFSFYLPRVWLFWCLFWSSAWNVLTGQRNCKKIAVQSQSHKTFFAPQTFVLQASCHFVNSPLIFWHFVYTNLMHIHLAYSHLIYRQFLYSHFILIHFVYKRHFNCRQFKYNDLIYRHVAHSHFYIVMSFIEILSTGISPKDT